MNCLNIVLCEAEGIMNNRPLTYLDEGSDVVPLTPNMFLRDLKEDGLPELFRKVGHNELSTRGELGTEMGDESDVCTKVSEAVKIAGFLEKRGSMLWKRYWFVLEDRLLLYYKSQLEYLNLSPCRGSVNMSLVSSVQPRRNSRDPVIHIVSRSSTLILRAYDRETQAKWLQSLLESMGKGPAPSQHLSLENLPSQISSLPHSRHSGSLDVIWRKIPPPTLGDDAEAEPQVTPADSRNSTLGRIKTALSRKPSSDSVSANVQQPRKRRESFLQKIGLAGRSKSKPENGTTEPESEEDPFYDTIGSNPNSITNFKEILPEQTMDELKLRLTKKEISPCIDPPELPPRVPTSTNSLINSADLDDSEESDISGHYQIIRKGQHPVKPPEGAEEQITMLEDNNRILTPEEKAEIYALYSVPKSKSSDSCASEYVTPSGSKECQRIIKDSNHNLVDKASGDVVNKVTGDIVDKLYHMRTREGIEMLIKELKDIESGRMKDIVGNKTIVSVPVEVHVTTLQYESKVGSSEPLIIEIRHDPNENNALGEEISQLEDSIEILSGTDGNSATISEELRGNAKDNKEEQGEVNNNPQEMVTLYIAEDIDQHNADESENEEIIKDMNIRKPETEQLEEIPQDLTITTANMSTEPDKDEVSANDVVIDDIGGCRRENEHAYEITLALKRKDDEYDKSVKDIMNCDLKDDDELRTNNQTNSKEELGTSDKICIEGIGKALREVDFFLNEAINNAVHEVEKSDVAETLVSESSSKPDDEMKSVDNNKELNDLNGEFEETKEVLLSVKQTADALLTTEINVEQLFAVEDGVSDLNSLLRKLTELTAAPVLAGNINEEVAVGNSKGEDPDYDIPRPHIAVASPISGDLNRLPATEFFTRVEEDPCCTENDSVEPDSLEAKKELIDIAAGEDRVTA